MLQTDGQTSKKLLSVRAGLISDFIIIPGSYRLTNNEYFYSHASMANCRAAGANATNQQFSNLAVPSNFYATAELFECKFNIELQATTGSQDDN